MINAILSDCPGQTWPYGLKRIRPFALKCAARNFGSVAPIAIRCLNRSRSISNNKYKCSNSPDMMNSIKFYVGLEGTAIVEASGMRHAFHF